MHCRKYFSDVIYRGNFWNFSKLELNFVLFFLVYPRTFKFIRILSESWNISFSSFRLFYFFTFTSPGAISMRLSG